MEDEAKSSVSVVVLLLLSQQSVGAHVNVLCSTVYGSKSLRLKLDLSKTRLDVHEFHCIVHAKKQASDVNQTQSGLVVSSRSPPRWSGVFGKRTMCDDLAFRDKRVHTSQLFHPHV